jgi:hypothetical protein
VADIADFMGERPVPRPPVKVVRDPQMESFREETRRVPYTPTAAEKRTGLRLEVTQQPCKAGACKHPPGTLCGSAVYEPDPGLDEVGVGWTAQHIRGVTEPVSYHCILCWTLAEHLELHDCAVLSVVNG